MREAFFDTLAECAEKDRDIYLLVADIGFGLVNPFSERFSDRYINVGVAEENMIGIATGMALTGKKVFVYSIANFPTMRCLEQICNDACYHNANVNIIGGSTGLTYGALGNSHHAIEDIAITRAIPNMTVIAPADKVETVLATQAMAKGIGTCYLRLGKSAEPTIHQKPFPFEIGKAITVMDGDRVALISTGSMLHISMQVAQRWIERGIQPLVLSMHTVKPIDKHAILKASVNCDAFITIEEHSIIGGLGSAVAEIIADCNLAVNFKRIGIRDEFYTKAGTQEELLKANKITVNDIVLEVEQCLISQ